MKTMVLPPDQPRRIDPHRTFEAIVSWIQEQAAKERAPGLIVGLSGTDSLLTFLACAAAFKNLGKPDRVLGVHFQHQPKPDADARISCLSSSFNWFAQDIIPWLRTQAPDALIEIDTSLPESDDNKRWGHLFSRAVRDTPQRQGLRARHYFTVGTRNATEEALGTYSQISRNVSMLPLVHLFKSEVLEICAALDVPQIAIDKSREIDCDCGRFETQAQHMRELDLFLMEKQGLLSKDWLTGNIPGDVLDAVNMFYVDEIRANDFRSRTPYRPANGPVIT